MINFRIELKKLNLSYDLGLERGESESSPRMVVIKARMFQVQKSLSEAKLTQSKDLVEGRRHALTARRCKILCEYVIR